MDWDTRSGNNGGLSMFGRGVNALKWGILFRGEVGRIRG